MKIWVNYPDYIKMGAPKFDRIKIDNSYEKSTCIILLLRDNSIYGTQGNIICLEGKYLKEENVKYKFSYFENGICEFNNYCSIYTIFYPDDVLNNNLFFYVEGEYEEKPPEEGGEETPEKINAIPINRNKKYKQELKYKSVDGNCKEFSKTDETRMGEFVEENSCDCGAQNRWIEDGTICDKVNKCKKYKLQIKNDCNSDWTDFLPLKYKIGEIIELESGECGTIDYIEKEILHDEYCGDGVKKRDRYKHKYIKKKTEEELTEICSPDLIETTVTCEKSLDCGYYEDANEYITEVEYVKKGCFTVPKLKKTTNVYRYTGEGDTFNKYEFKETIITDDYWDDNGDFVSYYKIKPTNIIDCKDTQYNVISEKSNVDISCLPYYAKYPYCQEPTDYGVITDRLIQNININKSNATQTYVKLNGLCDDYYTFKKIQIFTNDTPDSDCVPSNPYHTETGDKETLTLDYNNIVIGRDGYVTEEGNRINFLASNYMDIARVDNFTYVYTNNKGVNITNKESVNGEYFRGYVDTDPSQMQSYVWFIEVEVYDGKTNTPNGKYAYIPLKSSVDIVGIECRDGQLVNVQKSYYIYCGQKVYYGVGSTIPVRTFEKLYQCLPDELGINRRKIYAVYYKDMDGNDQLYDCNGIQTREELDDYIETTMCSKYSKDGVIKRDCYSVKWEYVVDETGKEIEHCCGSLDDFDSCNSCNQYYTYYVERLWYKNDNEEEWKPLDKYRYKDIVESNSEKCGYVPTLIDWKLRCEDLTYDDILVEDVTYPYSEITRVEGNWTRDGNTFTSNKLSAGSTKEKIFFTTYANMTEIKIDIKVSSERNYDYARVYEIDKENIVKTQISGVGSEGSNSYAETSVTMTTSVVGEHFIIISYDKDSSISEGKDEAIITVTINGGGGTVPEIRPQYQNCVICENYLGAPTMFAIEYKRQSFDLGQTWEKVIPEETRTERILKWKSPKCGYAGDITEIRYGDEICEDGKLKRTKRTYISSDLGQSWTYVEGSEYTDIIGEC